MTHDSYYMYENGYLSVEMKAALRGEQKINFIKRIREANPHLGLKEAKEAADAYCAVLDKYRRPTVEDFVRAVDSVCCSGYDSETRAARISTITAAYNSGRQLPTF